MSIVSAYTDAFDMLLLYVCFVFILYKCNCFFINRYYSDYSTVTSVDLAKLMGLNSFMIPSTTHNKWSDDLFDKFKKDDPDKTFEH